MCRHLAYLGPPVSLSALLFDAPHALVRQAWAPQDMRGGGTINVDGFGVGWFPPSGPAGEVPAGGPAGEVPASAAGPVRYRRDRPLWADQDLPVLAAATSAPAVLAAVRSATPGMPAGAAACAPFAGDGWLFSLNGRVAGWPDSVAPLAATLPATDLLTMESSVDAALVWLLVRHRLQAGAHPPRAVRDVVAAVAQAAPGSRLNLLLTNGQQVIATAVGHALSVRSGGGSVLVSSEPLDGDPAWQPVPDGSLLVATATRLHIQPIKE